MASDTRGPAPQDASEMTAEQLETMLAELDAICRQARELTTSIKTQMADQRHQTTQVLGPRRFLRLVAGRR